ncbi:response regulator transcription factor [Spirosoma utsteinense]|uniref:response regulator transcription factor n=1 Tax=Spirosoma utsteinense TaxID=2585773 RepID=UPI001644DA11|nr:response regulator transcription factor [Spirosoma utsteinense]MBC3787776.1 DNA-binding response OmpR family regulator [Spirosoma utsteinense]
MKLLLIEDEPDLSGDILAYLSQQGYRCELAPTFTTAAEKIVLYEYDCVIVDITLPGGNGLDLVRTLKKMDTQTGIVIISAKDSLTDKVTGLQLGADDYLTKPFHLAELSARLQSVLRRRHFGGRKEITIRGITIRPDELQVLIKGQPLDLTRKEYDLLSFLVANPGRVLTREAIAEHLWGDHMDQTDSLEIISTHVKNLRRKINERGEADGIKTVYGLGYKFER